MFLKYIDPVSVVLVAGATLLISFFMWVSYDESSLINVVYGHTKPPPGYVIVSNGRLFTFKAPGDNIDNKNLAAEFYRYRSCDCKHEAIRYAWRNYKYLIEKAKKDNPNWSEIDK